jgi:hypothetical protein
MDWKVFSHAEVEAHGFYKTERLKKRGQVKNIIKLQKNFI